MKEMFLSLLCTVPALLAFAALVDALQSADAAGVLRGNVEDARDE